MLKVAKTLRDVVVRDSEIFEMARLKMKEKANKMFEMKENRKIINKTNENKTSVASLSLTLRDVFEL